MGCISSKVLTRSGSFKEEVNQRIMHRTANAFPMLEEILVSKNGGDQFLALVCTTNAVAKRLHTESFSSESNVGIKPSLDVMHPEMINTWELMEGLDDEEQQQKLQSPPRVERPKNLDKQSQSFHWSSASESPTEVSFNVEECGLNGENGEIIHHSSFHTAQEYDAMVERNLLWKSQDNRFEDSVENTKEKLLDVHETSSKMCSSIEVDGNDLSHQGEGAAVNTNSFIEEIGVAETYKPKISKNEATNDFISCSCSNSDEVIESIGDGIEKGTAMKERGLRRKAMAKGLTTLKIQSAIEFPSVGSLKEWLDVGGQLFSPGSYVTPKFGCFSLPSPTNKNECNDGSVFDMELVTAFEEAMRQLKEEEKYILKQISDNLEEDVADENQVDQDTSPHRKEELGLALVLK
ncbi:PREDICTED: uncharacterized protein LOC104594338 [Nelumbo nucifera]|uniref:Uncharacterized protein n=2 Tax=Nelumbo nucifera TaxID=4432 RepID=A0A822XYB7_NELNU|nr:PREDICTED: uncharacterized protein LOC104594338 [Nelumbo nucifera]DAD23755.1 TPA_asm: hypothetical protein HUJ06_025218 [Nelumbo nucifera]